MELQEAVVAEGEMYKGDNDIELKKRQVAAARRRALAGNATEDAFYWHNKGLTDSVLVAGGAVDDVLPDEAELQDATLSSTKMALLENANKFGGLEEAGKALFDNDLTGIGGESMLGDDSLLRTDTQIHHDEVAEQVLLQDLDLF